MIVYRGGVLSGFNNEDSLLDYTYRRTAEKQP